jgi:hypothetical protein
MVSLKKPPTTMWNQRVSGTNLHTPETLATAAEFGAIRPSDLGVTGLARNPANALCLLANPGIDAITVMKHRKPENLGDDGLEPPTLSV